MLDQVVQVARGEQVGLPHVVVEAVLAPFARHEAAIARLRCNLEIAPLPLLPAEDGLPQGHLLVHVLFLQRGQRLRIDGRRHGSGRVPGLADKIHELLRHVLASLHERHGRSHESILVVGSMLRHGRSLLCS